MDPYIVPSICESSTYDHRVWRTGLPVRSAVLKPHAGRLVVGWVTTSESLLLYVSFLFIFQLKKKKETWRHIDRTGLHPAVELYISLCSAGSIYRKLALVEEYIFYLADDAWVQQ